jgi:5-methylcytosine-specific restriction endonuclease McrA
LENKVIYRSTRLEEMADWQREYRKTPQGKINDMIAKQKRRDLEKNLPCTLNPRQWLKILEMQNYKCDDCKREFGKKLIPTQDHIIPVTNIWCYGLTFGNSKALCVSCNSKKHNTFKLGNAIDNILVTDI